MFIKDLILFILVTLVVGESDKLVFRPNLYFGTRTMNDVSHMSGLMWMQGDSLDKCRHECRDEDHIKRWGWVEYNGKDYGYQNFYDKENKVVLKTYFLKKNDTNWSLRVTGKSLKSITTKTNITLIYYMVVDGKNSNIKVPSLSLFQRHNGIEGDVDISMTSDDLGSIKLIIPMNKTNISPTDVITHNTKLTIGKTKFIPLPACEECKNTHNALKESLQLSFQHRQQEYQRAQQIDNLPKDNMSPIFHPTIPLLSNSVQSGDNLIAIQKLPFSVDYIFTRNIATSSSLSSFFTTPEVPQEIKQFDQFEFKFGLKGSLFSDRQIYVARHMLSNLLGGIGWFNGNTVLKNEEGQNMYTDYGHLYTHVPSRSFFPRGFLWDEGFHLLVTCRWDVSLCTDILTSWFQRIYSNGYIEREQILGNESRSKVPSQFIPQSMDIANPPTLLLPLQYIYNYIQKKQLKDPMNEQIDIEFEDTEDIVSLSSRVSSLLPSITSWFDWFNSTQQEEWKEGEEAYKQQFQYRYRWKSRTEKHCLSSGIDDYPRHKIVTRGEGQIDLLIWTIYMGETLDSLMNLNPPDMGDREILTDYMTKLKNTIEHYWDEEHHIYTDIGAMRWNNNTKEYIYGYNNQKGYVSLFPFLFGYISPSSPHLQYILDDLTNPHILWSSFGIRSLSISSAYYGTDENYWRGSVWININYLVLRILNTKYMKEEGYQQERCKEIYTSLRQNIINNVISQYEKTGFVWESYNSETGSGKGVHPFTGWSTLVLLMMAEMY
ncbi:hypothetical protein WA158_002099 [Blastocystis sp. Blastoise]